jgi:hypothetical protein
MVVMVLHLALPELQQPAQAVVVLVDSQAQTWLVLAVLAVAVMVKKVFLAHKLRVLRVR